MTYICLIYFDLYFYHLTYIYYQMLCDFYSSYIITYYSVLIIYPSEYLYCSVLRGLCVRCVVAVL